MVNLWFFFTYKWAGIERESRSELRAREDAIADSVPQLRNASR